MNKNTARLGEAPVNQLLLSLSLPAMVGMLVTALYNIVDTIFVAQGIGTAAVAAVGIAFPVQLVLMAIANSIGIGGAAIASQRLGQKQTDSASRAYANVLMAVFFISMLAIISAFIFVEPLLRLFGATDEIMPYSIAFLRVLLIGSPFFMLTMASSAMLRAEGRANYQMRVMLTTVAINIVLTPLFIFGLDWGIQGAALGTVVAQIVGALLVFRFFFTKRRQTGLTLNRSAFKPDFRLTFRMMQIGSSSFIMQVSQSVLFITVNHMLVRYGGTTELATFAVINKFMALVGMPIMGIVQGMQPIVGYNFGSRQFSRMSLAIKLAIRYGLSLSISLWLLIQLFPRFWVGLFTEEATLLQEGSSAMRILFALSFVYGIQMIVNGMYQSLAKAKVALFLSLSRQTLYTIPLVLILPVFFGVNGVWFAFPIADAMAVLTALVFAYKDRVLLFKPEEYVAEEQKVATAK
ncbi:MATE family efflux transporter [Exiguobacterium sp. Leaf196]|uniref:MATE family efflux transporter n=1 Tax=Exiguobacterium sp. Leaf196 TaxID=1736298 RepID=UPI0006F47C05|nr:MATE family efflux transporter [Exiguobacterium sp. Leaf196]KQS44513.1 MATE family efflux transporter [Exiguobacterium sp. Leaf196]